MRLARLLYIPLALLPISAWSVSILPGVPTPPAGETPHPVMPHPMFPTHPVMPHPIFPHPVMPDPIFPVHPVMPHPIFPHPVMPPINPFNPMPGPVIPANTCPSSLNIELVNSLNLGQLLFEDNNRPAQFTVSPTGNISNISNIQSFNSKPASYLLEGPPGTVVTLSFNNIVTSNLHITNFTTNLPNNQCTLNTNGLCTFSVGATFEFPKHLKTNDGKLDLEIPFTLNCLNLLK